MTDTQILKGIYVVLLILFLVALIKNIVILIQKIREEVPSKATNVIRIIGYFISSILEIISILML